MGAVPLRGDYDAARVRAIAARSGDGNKVRRLLAIAAVYDGLDRAAAARVGGMDRQTLRDWVHRFNDEGPDGLVNRKGSGSPPKLTAAQREALAAVVEAGPDPAVDGVVRWRCLDLKAWIQDRFGVVYDQRSVARILKGLGFSHVSPRPRHPAQKPEVLEDFKKTSRGPWHRP